MIIRKEVADLISMHPNLLTNFVNGNKPLTAWAAHNIGLGINHVTGMRLFEVQDELGIMIPSKGRPPKLGFRGYGLKPYTPVKKRRRRRATTT